MSGWAHAVLVSVSVLILAVILFVLITILKCFFFKKWHRSTSDDAVHVLDHTTTRTRTDRYQRQELSLQEGIAKLHQLDQSDSKRNYNVFRRGAASTRPLFTWADHPSLVTDAVENGWSRFGFTGYMASSPSTKSSLLGFCAVGDHTRELETEITWEVCQGSADLMQKIRLKSGLKNSKVNTNKFQSMSAVSVIRTALPLPGPPLGNSAFPQEAYFEITILNCSEDDCECNDPSSFVVVKDHSEKTKLILENNSDAKKANPDKVEELKLTIRDDFGCKGHHNHGEKDGVMLSVGFIVGGSLPLKLPGSFQGSVGFNSNGSVFLDGTKLVTESESAVWARQERVIGCGFNPRQKKVFFTVDAELVHEIYCKTEEFGAPMYPTIAANNDMWVLVNFGQSVFSYAPANANRTPNPCFIGPLVNSPALGYDDSKELFSMGRIDSQWLNQSATKHVLNNNSSSLQATDFDGESDADLFEIVLDTSSDCSTGRSPNILL